MESERFRTCVLRLFHTELETVYKNIIWVRIATEVKCLKHITSFISNTSYGTQTTIGDGKHLKNPSMVNIMGYFYTFMFQIIWQFV
ncbi:MAG: hypothetical protein IPH42_04435 [Bacteroidetes bacterium]|nr:hypothetical protein [Bacteroidota bacterium]